MVVRIELSELGQPALPAVDVDEPFAIGSGASARIRVPAASGARDVHVEIAGGKWRACGGVATVDGEDRDGGELADGVVFELGRYRVRVAPAPVGAIASPPQRTESLARELLRGLLGDDGAPSLVIERGPIVGAKRALAPPESRLVIGRGDEASWVIADRDLSRTHVELVRGWDGVRARDLGSKNGTRVDGEHVDGAAGRALCDGATIELGNVVMRFRDPAERHLRGDAPAPAPVPAHAGRAEPRAADAGAKAHPSTWPFYAALALCALALAALAWIVAS